MAKLGTGSSRPAGVRAENDIYTVLMCIAFLFMLVATIFVGYRVVTLFGSVLPPGGS
jgi:hypothetical protein